jgi:hypothetical protein
VETQSGVSGGVGRHRQMPLCPTRSVVFCRRLSPGVGGHWGRYWGTSGKRGFFYRVGGDSGRQVTTKNGRATHPGWVVRGMGERFLRAKQLEHRVQMLLRIFSTKVVLP